MSHAQHAKQMTLDAPKDCGFHSLVWTLFEPFLFCFAFLLRFPGMKLHSIFHEPLEAAMLSTLPCILGARPQFPTPLTPWFFISLESQVQFSKAEATGLLRPHPVL